MSPAGKKCLVLGGKGFVGSAMVSMAAAMGYEVLAIDKDEYEAARGTACDLLINANGNSKKFLAAKNPRLEFDLSVRSVLQSLHDFKYARYVFLSTMDVYFPHVSHPDSNREDTACDPARQSPYGFHKMMAEQLVRYYAKDPLIFRMAGFVGRGLWKNSIHDLLHDRPLRVHPDSAYQYINTTDLARIVLSIAARAPEPGLFNIAGEGLISLREVAALIPGCRCAEEWDQLPLERYELNIERIKQWEAIPATRPTVERFIRETLEQRSRTS